MFLTDFMMCAILNVRKNVQGGIVMSITNATTARKNFFRIMDEAIDGREPVCVTGKKGNVVIVAEDDWRSIQETLYLVSIPGMRDKLLHGLATPNEECAMELPEWLVGK